MYISVCVSLNVQMLPEAEEDVGLSPGTGITGGCELSDTGAGNGSRILWKNSK